MATDSPNPVIPSSSSPLLQYSLAGQGNALQQEAQQQVPLLANVMLMGQTAVWYGAPNTGKTLVALSLVLKAITDKRIVGSKVFYVNADDSASGMALKTTILDDLGAHTLCPGYNGFELSALAPALEQMASDGSAKGSLIIIDTLKKVADLMSKKECARFGKVARTFSLQGGSILGLAHTNKNPGPSGKLIYAGNASVPPFRRVRLAHIGPRAEAPLTATANSTANATPGPIALRSGANRQVPTPSPLSAAPRHRAGSLLNIEKGNSLCPRQS